MRLERLLIERAQKTPDAPALHAPDGRLSYRQLDRLADQLAHLMAPLGAGPDTRVGIWLDKSTVAVAAMQAALRLGAAYVPLDPLSPRARIATMLTDCAATVLVTTSERAQRLPEQVLTRLQCLAVGERSGDASWDTGLATASGATPAVTGARAPRVGTEDDMAFILYTSGSTGTPKGVCISHRNAWAFIDWAASTIGATAADRFSNHAPFHFDLSVLDLYGAFLVGARVSLAPANISYLPTALVAFLQAEDITVWYSVPSALTMMMESTDLLDRPALQPRVVIFAGEAFPMPQLRRLRERWRSARFFNFYGPTETNVCTAYEVPTSGLDACDALPIGTAASGDTVWLESEEGRRADVGQLGEVIVAGPTVMLGYWGQTPQSGPYRTGDLARVDSAGTLTFHGRRDHMVKVRGHRVELGEIESVLATHPAVEEVAAAVQGDGRSARLIAVLVGKSDQPRPSLLAIKKLCAERLPRYMIVDRVRWLSALPRTGNGKLDRARLLEVSESQAPLTTAAFSRST